MNFKVCICLPRYVYISLHSKKTTDWAKHDVDTIIKTTTMGFWYFSGQARKGKFKYIQDFQWRQNYKEKPSNLVVTIGRRFANGYHIMVHFLQSECEYVNIENYQDLVQRIKKKDHYFKLIIQFEITPTLSQILGQNNENLIIPPIIFEETVQMGNNLYKVDNYDYVEDLWKQFCSNDLLKDKFEHELRKDPNLIRMTIAFRIHNTQRMGPEPICEPNYF